MYINRMISTKLLSWWHTVTRYDSGFNFIVHASWTTFLGEGLFVLHFKHSHSTSKYFWILHVFTFFNICCLIPASLCDKCSVFILWFQIPISNQRGIRGNNLVAFGVFFLFEVSFLILYVFSSLGEYLAKQSRKLVKLAKVGQSILLLIKIFLTNFGSSCNAIKIWTEKQLILNS